MTDNKKSPVNPPADSNPEVKAAKAKVNPQAVGAVLAENEAAKPKPTPTQVEESAKDFYAKEKAPVSPHVGQELPAKGEPNTEANDVGSEDSDVADPADEDNTDNK